MRPALVDGVAVMCTTCICGKEFGSNVAIGQHYASCEKLPAAMKAEYVRISDLIGKMLVQRKQWDELRGCGYPSSSYIVRWKGSWAAMQAFCIGGEAIFSNGSYQYLPPIPEGWVGAMQEGSYFGRYAAGDAALNVFAEMVRVARMEAGGTVTHWRTVLPEHACNERVEDAKQWLRYLQEATRTVPTHIARMRGTRNYETAN